MKIREKDETALFLGIDGGGSGCRVRLPDRTGPMLVAARHDPLHGAVMLAGSALVEP